MHVTICSGDNQGSGMAARRIHAAPRNTKRPATACGRLCGGHDWIQLWYHTGQRYVMSSEIYVSPRRVLNEDPLTNLLVAIVQQAYVDLQMPTRSRNDSQAYPTVHDKRDALAFVRWYERRLQ